MDSKYLNEIMKEPLAECLAEVCFKKPLDPIEYIALWLYKYDKKIKQDSVVRISIISSKMDRG